MYHQIPVSLTKAQFDKMRRGQPIQLARHQIGGAARHHLMLHHESAKKVHAAHRKGKGTRIHVSPHELEASGEGLREFWQGLKKAGSWVKQNIIDTPLYQSSVKPLVRQAVDAGLALAAPSLGPVAGLATQGVHALGDKTSAFGVKMLKKHSKKMHSGGALSERDHEMIREYASEPVIYSGNRVPKDIKKGYYLSQDMSRLLTPIHPAMWPPYTALAPIGGKLKKKGKKPGPKGFGGSFLPA